jgi:hypothetical protein
MERNRPIGSKRKKLIQIILNEVPHTGSDRNATELFVNNILTDFKAFRLPTHAH